MLLLGRELSDYIAHLDENWGDPHAVPLQHWMSDREERERQRQKSQRMMLTFGVVLLIVYVVAMALTAAWMKRGKKRNLIYLLP